jgi:hypothetical protein
MLCLFEVKGGRIAGMNEDLITDLKHFITATTSQQTAELRLGIRALQSDVRELQAGQKELRNGQGHLHQKSMTYTMKLLPRSMIYEKKWAPRSTIFPYL